MDVAPLKDNLMTMVDIFNLDIVILLFYFLDYVSLRRLLATEKILWELQKRAVLLPFFEKRKINFIISTISDWWKNPTWIRVDLIGSFYKERF